MKNTLLPLFVLLFLSFSCSKTTTKAKSEEEQLISYAIKAHGGILYDKANYSFDFRGKNYLFRNNGGAFNYVRTSQKANKTIVDSLTNAGFTRTIDGVAQTLSSKKSLGYGNSLNSVIYFALLPYKLEDPAVKKTKMGTVFIKGQEYHQLEIRFTEEGGGTDHDDVFYYWLHKTSYTVDYLAYRFHVNNGGVRFRTAFNPRIIDGIRFQDYVNYKASADTPLKDLPRLFEEGKLEELSKIELQNIKLLVPEKVE